MKVMQNIFLALLAAHFTQASVLNRIFPRQGANIQTTFLDYEGCGDRKAIIEKANSDALILADAALEIKHDELIADNDPVSAATLYYVDFNKQAAIDYFGPPNANAPYQEFIQTTLIRAKDTSRSFLGIGDWWNDRYIKVSCVDHKNECGTTSAAYTSNPAGQYSIITYCPAFFDVLESHDTMVSRIDQDKTGQKKLNLRNLRSQATTVLHEWLHVKNKGGVVCEGGCLDYYMTIGGQRIRSYKPGRTKLLARTKIMSAYKNNDNYAYFATARFMEKRWGVYPQYPLMWDANKSIEENQRIEDQQPGTPLQPSSQDIDDGHAETDGETPSNDVSTPIDLYPDWYKPFLSAVGATRAPSVLPPPTFPPVYTVPHLQSGHCVGGRQPANYEDCIHAFGGLLRFRDALVLHGRKGGNWWASYVQSCAINVHFEEDWTDACEAKLRDVYGHANSIFMGCANGLAGTVDAAIPFIVPNCPATIEIINTAGKQPPNGQP